MLPDLRGGGAERIRLDLAHQFKLLGHSPEFVLMKSTGEFLSEAEACYPVIDLNCSRVRELPFALAQYLRLHQPDALLAAMWPLTVIAPVASRLSGHNCPVVISEHGILSAQYKNLGRAHKFLLRGSTWLGYRLASGCIGVSRGVVHDMAILSGIPPSKFTVVNNPVRPLGQPTSEQINRVNELWSSPSGSRILTVASMKPVKNHKLLLHAFAQLSCCNAKLMIVGQGKEERTLRQLALELGIDDGVIFAGFQADPSPFYATADLFVLSSDYEGFGNVIVEALSQGLPVVTTDCPSGPAEIIEDGRWGRLVPVGDVTALAKAIQEALQAEHDPEGLKRRAAVFAPEIATRKYLDLLLPV